MFKIKNSARKFVGQFYRLLQQYKKSKQVFNPLIDLSGYSIRYYSVMQQRNVSEAQLMQLVESGDIIKVDNLIAQLDLQQQLNEINRQYFDLDYEQLSQIHKLQSVEQVFDNSLNAKDPIAALVLQSSILHCLLQPHNQSSYLELQPDLRLHLPCAQGKAKEAYIGSKMGRGKINPHGQHKDTWRSHPKNSLNVWVSLNEDYAKNGLALLLQNADYHPKFSANEREMVPA